jgi:hypothetical protein
MCTAFARGVDDARLGLVEGLLAATDPELGPPGDELRGVEEFVVEPEAVEHRGVALDVAGARGDVLPGHPVLDDQPAGPGDDLLAG